MKIRRVGWSYHIRITKEHRSTLDTIASQSDVFRHPDGRPHDAELVRLLMISAAYQSESVEKRVVLALRSSAVLMFAQEFSQMLADLQSDLGLPALRRTKMSGKMQPRRAPEKRYVPRTDEERDRDYRCHVHLTVDDALRTVISDRVKQSGKQATTVAREFFEDAMLNLESHQPVIDAYAKTVDDVRKELQHVAKGGRWAILHVLRHPSLLIPVTKEK